MQWTKEKADRFLKAISDANLTALGIAPENMSQAINEATIYSQGYSDGLQSTPAPAPAPNPSPSPLLMLAQNMKWDANAGCYVTTPDFLSGGSKAVLHLDGRPFMGYGKTVVINARRKSKHPTTQKVAGATRMNLKIFRPWSQLDGIHYPNFYYGVPDWSAASPDWMVYVEPLDFTKDGMRDKCHWSVPAWPCGDEQLHDEHFELQYPSALGAADGRLLIKCDGKTMLDTKTMQMNGGPVDPSFSIPVLTGLIDRFCLQTVLDQAAFPAGSYVNFYDVEINGQRIAG